MSRVYGYIAHFLEFQRDSRLIRPPPNIRAPQLALEVSLPPNYTPLLPRLAATAFHIQLVAGVNAQGEDANPETPNQFDVTSTYPHRYN